MEKKLYTESSIKEFLEDAAAWKRKVEFLSALFCDDAELNPRGVKMQECGHWLTFDADPPGVSGVAEYRLTHSNFCRQRLCPMCQWRRSRMIFAHLTDVVDQLRDQDFDVLHVVLTVRHLRGCLLTDQITRMYKAFSSLTKEPMLSGWKGSLRFLEVSYNCYDRTYHPHLHVLVAVKPSYFKSRYYVAQEKLARLWKNALDLDYVPLVHISKCDPRAILEVAKYCVKPFDFEHFDLADCLSIYQCFDVVLHNRRLIQSYGVFREVIRACKLDDTLDDEPDREYSLDELGDELSESRLHRVFSYNAASGRYELC